MTHAKHNANRSGICSNGSMNPFLIAGIARHVTRTGEEALMQVGREGLNGAHVLPLAIHISRDAPYE